MVGGEAGDNRRNDLYDRMMEYPNDSSRAVEVAEKFLMENPSYSFRDTYIAFIAYKIKGAGLRLSAIEKAFDGGDINLKGILSELI